MSDLGTWLKTIPQFTRYWFCLTIAFSLAGRFRIINPYYLVLTYSGLQNFEIWRLLTGLFYFPINSQTGFHFLINLYFMYNYSRRLEESTFAGKPADYLFMLLFNLANCIIFGLFMELSVLMDPMVLSVLYVWCQLNRETIVSFWFGTRFKAVFLPWVLLGFNLVINGGGVMELVGIVIGHIYFFLMFKYPQELGGPALLQTPGFLKSWFPEQVGGVYGFGAPPPQPQGAPPMGGGRHWGRGQALGGS